MTAATLDGVVEAPGRLPAGASRAAAVLARFPRYVEAEDPGKRLGAVVAALAAGLDVLTRQVQDVRVAHRVTEAPTPGDLLALAAVHGLGDERLALLDRRDAVLAEAAAQAPLDPAAVAGHLALAADEVAALAADAPDALASALAAALGHGPRTGRRRTAVLEALAAGVRGAGTAGGLLRAAAAYTGLAAGDVVHVPGGWWHLARCEDTTRLRVAEPGGTRELEPVPDVVALEENPFRTADLDPAPKRHGQRTRVLRGGLEDVDVGVRVVGTGTRTVRPVVVHLGSGTGLVYEGSVPDGAELVFAATGRVLLDGADVTGSAWSFAGGVFADAAQVLAADDAVFAGDGTPPARGRTATFAVATPSGAFDVPSGLPHGAAAVGPLRLPRGESRWTVLVRTARTAGADGPPVPRPLAGRFDESVLAAGPGEVDVPALQLGFVWEEREPFAVRVLLPGRLAAADDDAGTRLRAPLTRLLDRHRAAGVALRVEYADPRWRLGEGVLRDREDDALGVVLDGTQLWPDDTPPDGPQGLQDEDEET